MSQETKVIFEEYKGNPVLAIWASNGNSRAPIVSFGFKKAMAILKHIEEIQEWVTALEEKKTISRTTEPSSGATSSASTVKIDLSKMSSEQQKAFTQLLGAFTQN